MGVLGARNERPSKNFRQQRDHQRDAGCQALSQRRFHFRDAKPCGLLALLRYWGINPVEQRQRTLVLYVNIHPRPLDSFDVSRFQPVEENRSPQFGRVGLFRIIKMLSHSLTKICGKTNIQHDS